MEVSENIDITIKEQIANYTKLWKWFVIGAILAITGAFIYLRYSTFLYETKATVIVKEDQNSASEMSPFSGMGRLFSRYRYNEIENELAIFRSKRLITETVKKLNLNIAYESIGAIKTTELYKNKPFIVQYLSFTDSIEQVSVPKLYVEILTDSEFNLENEAKSIQGKYLFGEKIDLPFGEIIVIPTTNDLRSLKPFFGRNISVHFRPVENVSQSFQNRIRIKNDIKNSYVVELKIQSPITEKAEDFINELIYQYNKDAINDRNLVAQKTSNFIDSRLQIITHELDSVEQDKVTFKSTNLLTDLTAEAQMILESASEFDKRQFDVSTQLELAKSMINYVENTSFDDLLPSNIGLQGDELGNAVDNYNSLILQRNKLLKNSTTKNPVIINLNNQIAQYRNTILVNLRNSRNSLEIAIRDLDIKESVYNSKITEVPAKEKIFRDIERQQTIKEQLYLFLLKQREEANISLAVTSPKAKIIDNAYSSKSPVSPNRLIIYLGALLCGILLPFLIIYTRLLLNTKITNRRDVEIALSEVPLIGEIPKIRNGEKDSEQHNDRSILAESYRILRTNLQYLFINKLNNKNIGHTVFVTSTIKGEGKTFIAYNLAITLAFTGKRVVLVGADIRNPQLQRYLKTGKVNKGITNYIVNSDVTLDEIVNQSSNNKHLKIILSGDIPPNPAELLMQERTKDLFNELKNEFDYVIVDTAPSMLVTDTILINKLADVTLYAIRAGFTDKKLLEFPKDAINDGRLSNVALVLNHVDMNNFGYGNKYGYSYTKDTSPFYKKIFK